MLCEMGRAGQKKTCPLMHCISAWPWFTVPERVLTLHQRVLADRWLLGCTSVAEAVGRLVFGCSFCVSNGPNVNFPMNLMSFPAPKISTPEIHDKIPTCSHDSPMAFPIENACWVTSRIRGFATRPLSRPPRTKRSW